MTEAKKKYLKGRRKFVTQLLAYTKERIKLFNVITHNGTPYNIALKFIQTACDYLPQKTFQHLYGLSMSDIERKDITIQEVKDFVAEYDVAITPVCTKEICYCNNHGVCLDQRWRNILSDIDIEGNIEGRPK